MGELVFLRNEEAMTDSLMVSEMFGKRHDLILRSIDTLSESLRKNEERPSDYFRISNRKADDGQFHRMYLMNRDGFSLLVMGFTGEKALKWKLKYIEAFNKMEVLIREKSTSTWLETRKAGKLTRKAETDTIKKLIEYAKEQGSEHADMLYMTYSRLANKMAGIKNRDEATTSELNILSLMENIVLHEIDNGILAEKHYKQIYQDCKNRMENVRGLAYLSAGC